MPARRSPQFQLTRFEQYLPQVSRAHAQRDLRLFLRRLAFLFLLITNLVLVGTVGFALLEGLSLWQGFLNTLDIVATIGSRKPGETTGGEVLWVVLVTLGVGTMFYALITLTEFIVAGHISGLLDVRRMERKIDALSNHYIICGFGRVGRQVARDLKRAGVPIVVIDSNPEVMRYVDEMGVPFVEGPVSDEEVLKRAGIRRARGVLACVDSDAENVFITMTARGLSEEIEIVARASEDATFPKLERAGADRVVSPYMTSGEAMAKLVLQPGVGEYLDVVSGSAAEMRMEEIELIGACEGLGCTVEQVNRRGVKAKIVGVRKAGGEFELDPEPGTVLGEGDAVIAIGTVADMEVLEELFAPVGDGGRARKRSRGGVNL